MQNKNSNPNNLHIFDFCGTITTNQTADDFVHFVIRFRRFHRIIYRLLKKIQQPINSLIRREVIGKRQFLYLVKGLDSDYIESQSIIYAKWLYYYFIRSDVMDLINSLLKNESNKVIILSAGYSVYIDKVAEMIGIDEVHASKMESKNNMMTGRFDRSLYELDKYSYLKDFLRKSHFVNTYFYSDSVSDLMCLETVDNPILVYPDRDLFALSIKMGWKILND
jgi:HAD superfamily phosphoserine phosphatase-like hydrolase